MHAQEKTLTSPSFARTNSTEGLILEESTVSITVGSMESTIYSQDNEHEYRPRVESVAYQKGNVTVVAFNWNNKSLC